MLSSKSSELVDSLGRKVLTDTRFRRTSGKPPLTSDQPVTAASKLKEVQHCTDLLSMGYILASLWSSLVAVLDGWRSYKNIRCFPKETGGIRKRGKFRLHTDTLPWLGLSWYKLTHIMTRVYIHFRCNSSQETHQTTAPQKVLAWMLMFAHRNK